jgi:hypothetical protein
MIRLFDNRPSDDRLAECALRARTTRPDKPNFPDSREQTSDPCRFHTSLVLSR